MNLIASTSKRNIRRNGNNLVFSCFVFWAHLNICAGAVPGDRYRQQRLHQHQGDDRLPGERHRRHLRI